QDLTIEDRISRTQYQFTLTSPETGLLSQWVPQMVAALSEEPALADVASDLQDAGVQAYLDIDRDAAARLGISIADINDALYNAFGQRQVSTIFTQSNQYRVVLEVDPQFQQGPQSLSQIRVPGADGSQVPIMSVATISERPASLLINHLGQFPAAT